MATPNSTWTPIGARHCRIYALSTSTGIIEPGAASATAYAGIWASGIKGMELTDPEPQQLNHLGDDEIFLNDSLPATEAITGNITTGKIQLDLHNALTGDETVTLNEKVWRPMGSNNRGSELQVAVLIYQQALDSTPGATTEGSRRWSWALFPKVLMIPLEPGMGGTEFTMTYTLRPQRVSSYPWGTSFTVATEGSTRMYGLRGVGEYKPILAAWKGDAIITSFNLPTDYPAVTTDKVTAFVYDDSAGSTSDDTSAATITATAVDPSATPAEDDILIAFYEHNQAEIS